MHTFFFQKRMGGRFSPCTTVNVAISHVGANGNVLCLYQLCYDSLDVLQVTFGCCVFVGVSGTLYSKNTKTVLSVQDTGVWGKQAFDMSLWFGIGQIVPAPSTLKPRSNARRILSKERKTNCVSCFLTSLRCMYSDAPSSRACLRLHNMSSVSQPCTAERHKENSISRGSLFLSANSGTFMLLICQVKG